MTTVEDLIEFLQQCDPALPVKLSTSGGDSPMTGMTGIGETATVVMVVMRLRLSNGASHFDSTVASLLAFLIECDQNLPVEIWSDDAVYAIGDMSEANDLVTLCAEVTAADWDEELGLLAGEG